MSKPAQSAGGLRLLVAGGLLGISAALALAQARPVATPRRIVIHGTGDPAPAARGSAVARSFSWEDPNTLKVISQSADGVVVDPAVRARRLELPVTADRDELVRAVARFGAPASWLQISFSSEQERKAAAAEQRRRLASRGILLGDDNVARVDYAWVVEGGKGDLREVAEGLRRTAETAGYEDARGVLGMIASFVQALRYEEQPLFRAGSGGERIYTGGITVPLETVATATGDCDTRAVLLAAILANFSSTGVVFMEGDSHVFAGLRMPPRVGDRYVSVQGIDYVLVELTSAWPLGVIPEQRWLAVRGRALRLIPIV